MNRFRFDNLPLHASLIVVAMTPALAAQESAEEGSCCRGGRLPGCDNAICRDAVCSCDPFCCAVVWDDDCAGFGQDENGCGAAALCSICADADADGVFDDVDVCCDTDMGVTVDEEGRPRGDLDGDCDVDLADYAIFHGNFRGAAGATGPCCLLSPSDCDDGDLCTVDSCDPVSGCRHMAVTCGEGLICDPATGACVSPTCSNDAECDDGLFCTGQESCNPEHPDAGANGCLSTGDPCAGSSTPGCDENSDTCLGCTSNAQCDDGLACTIDTCNLGPSRCEHTSVDAACNDGNYCSGSWMCDPSHANADAYGCVSTGDPCIAGPDGVGKICNEATDACDDCTSAAQCDDGFLCTDDTCIAGTCNYANIDANCPDALNCDGVDFCDPANPNADDDGCVPPGDPCDPKLCDEATYVVGDPGTCVDCTSNADCNDVITCTLDTCDGVTGNCWHTPDDALCPDASFCDGVDTCDPADPDADVDGCVPNPWACGNACNENTDSCFDCTSNADCNDGIPCTDDTCDGGTGICTHADNCGIATCNVQSGQCQTKRCGDGFVSPGEQCDDAGESTACDSDCSFVACGDGITNVTAGEQCDDGGESAVCDGDCTLQVCGDGHANATAGEACDDGNQTDSDGCSQTCQFENDCGNGIAEPGEECDTGGDSATCDFDCTFVVCGDGHVNDPAGEECDPPGETCDYRCWRQEPGEK